MPSTRECLSEHFRKVRERDERWIMQFQLGELNRFAFPLLLAFLVLNFADVSMTLVAIGIGPPFVELNPVASELFKRQFQGFLLALLLKYVPMVPIAYLALLRDIPARPVRIRVLKFAVLIVLVSGILIYSFIVGLDASNLFIYFTR